MGYKFSDEDNAAFRDLLARTAYVQDTSDIDLTQPADNDGDEDDEDDEDALDLLLDQARTAKPGSDEFDDVLVRARALIATRLEKDPENEILRAADEKLEQLQVINWDTEFDMNAHSIQAAATWISSTAIYDEDLEGCTPCQQRAEAARLASRQPVERATWQGVLGVEGELTGDGRFISPGALRWETLPIPLRYVSADTGAHQGAVVVGRIDKIERNHETGEIMASGDFDLDSESGREAARQVGAQLMQGISMDLDDVAFEVRIAADAAALVGQELPLATEPVDYGEPDEDGRVKVEEMASDDEVMVTTDARIRAGTIVAIPAFARALISLTASGSERRTSFTISPPAYNWVDDVGGLPKYIKRIADAIQKTGKEEGHAIAIAVNAVKKMCATGDLNFPGKQDVNPGSKAEACAAVAEWEEKKARANADAGSTETFADEPETEESDGLADAREAIGLLEDAEAVGFPSEEYLDLAAEAQVLLTSAVGSGELDADQQTVAQEVLDRLDIFLATDWSEYDESNIGSDDKTDLLEDTAGLLAAAPKRKPGQSPPRTPETKEEGGKEQVRVPKGNPDGGQYKEVPHSQMGPAKDKLLDKESAASKKHRQVGQALRNAMALVKKLLAKQPDNPALQALQKTLADTLATRRRNAANRADPGSGNKSGKSRGPKDKAPDRGKRKDYQERLAEVTQGIREAIESMDNLGDKRTERLKRILANLKEGGSDPSLSSRPTSFGTAWRDYKPETREKQADKGEALPDGSYPIANCTDLKNAIQAIGRASDPAKAKAHIKKRASALKCDGVEIPDDWASSKEQTMPVRENTRKGSIRFTAGGRVTFVPALTLEEGRALAARMRRAVFAYNKDQWRNPKNGKWIDMPGTALDNLAGFFDPDKGSMREMPSDVIEAVNAVIENVKDMDDPDSPAYGKAVQAASDAIPDVDRAIEANADDLHPTDRDTLETQLEKVQMALDAYEISWISGEEADLVNSEDDDLDAEPTVPERSHVRPGGGGDFTEAEVKALQKDLENSISDIQGDNPDVNPDDIHHDAAQGVAITAQQDGVSSEAIKEFLKREGVEAPVGWDDEPDYDGTSMKEARERVKAEAEGKAPPSVDLTPRGNDLYPSNEMMQGLREAVEPGVMDGIDAALADGRLRIIPDPENPDVHGLQDTENNEIVGIIWPPDREGGGWDLEVGDRIEDFISWPEEGPDAEGEPSYADFTDEELLAAWGPVDKDNVAPGTPEYDLMKELEARGLLDDEGIPFGELETDEEGGAQAELDKALNGPRMRSDEEIDARANAGVVPATVRLDMKSALDNIANDLPTGDNEDDAISRARNDVDGALDAVHESLGAGRVAEVNDALDFLAQTLDGLVNALDSEGLDSEAQALVDTIENELVNLRALAVPDSLQAGAYPDAPPSAWFNDPKLTGPTALTVTKDGRIYGHLATWGMCHLSHTAGGKCVVAPKSNSGYAYFHTGSIFTADGAEIPVGHITLDTRHAKDDLRAAPTLAHYDNTGLCAADVVAGEDEHGIWVAGALRSTLTEDKVRALRSAPLSGDWRRIGTNLELVAALAVNVPGFPIPRPKGMVASGTMTSLVAAGMLPPRKVKRPGTPGALSIEDLRYLKRLVARERAEEDQAKLAVLSNAQTLARRLRAQAMARRVQTTIRGGQ